MLFLNTRRPRRLAKVVREKFVPGGICNACIIALGLAHPAVRNLD
jgi:hypothetical protein